MLNWVNRFSIFCFLDNHQYKLTHHSIECILGAGSIRHLTASAGDALDQLGKFLTVEDDWTFGHLGYDLKNEIEELASQHPDQIQFPDLFFFVPEVVIQLSASEITIGSCRTPPGEYLEQINGSPVALPEKEAVAATIQSRFPRNDYIETVEKLRQHILRGDCYEINFCQEFYATDVVLDPLATFWSLSKASPNPFSAFYRLHDKYLLCASPERFLKKEGQQLYSQPIKGTSRRDPQNSTVDAFHKETLAQSTKDRAENVMVVDLVRNDLSRVCKEGTVQVEELFGIYSFPQVHQMISTIRGELLTGTSTIDILRACFPMGSMTGAPKNRVMQLIERYERSRRGIFSGAVGYFAPNKDFDFNVVIRSILYNATSKYLSFPAGSAITFYSNPEQEYEECLLKAAAIKKVLTG